MKTSETRRWRVAIQVLAVLGVAAAASSGAQSQPLTAMKAPKVTRIVIVKSKRTMALVSEGQIVKTYKVALGTEPLGLEPPRTVDIGIEGEVAFSSSPSPFVSGMW